VIGAAVAAGTNASSVTVSPNGAFAYVANSGGNNVSAYSIGSYGALSDVFGGSCGSGLPNNCFTTGTSPQAVAVSPNGAYAYVANWGGGVSAYTIDAATGALTPISLVSPFTAGAYPISLAITP